MRRRQLNFYHFVQIGQNTDKGILIFFFRKKLPCSLGKSTLKEMHVKEETKNRTQ